MLLSIYFEVLLLIDTVSYRTPLKREVQQQQVQKNIAQQYRSTTLMYVFLASAHVEL